MSMVGLLQLAHLKVPGPAFEDDLPTSSVRQESHSDAIEATRSHINSHDCHESYNKDSSTSGRDYFKRARQDTESTIVIGRRTCESVLE